MSRRECVLGETVPPALGTTNRDPTDWPPAPHTALGSPNSSIAFSPPAMDRFATESELRVA